MELSVLCNCRIGLILFDGNGRLHDFTTEDMRTLVSDYFAKELYETNTKEEVKRHTSMPWLLMASMFQLYRRYNAKEAVQASANKAELYVRSHGHAIACRSTSPAGDQEDRKAEGIISADADRTEETVVDVESNSDINNLDISRASSTHTGQKIETRSRVRSNAQPSNRGSVTLSPSIPLCVRSRLCPFRNTCP